MTDFSYFEMGITILDSVLQFFREEVLCLEDTINAYYVAGEVL